MDFQLLAKDKDSDARVGKLITDHGAVKTPAFMPVGTKGGVKGAHLKDLTDEIGAQILLSNTYHLYLRPGVSIIEKAGGLHEFMQWQGPILTDSGGYQVYSLADIREIEEEGVEFQSHIDGSKHLFTPERVIDIQQSIGADLIMAFDECPPYPCDHEYAAQSWLRTERWLHRCFDAFENSASPHDYEQALLPIIQGGVYEDLREKSTKSVQQYPSVGYAIGGLSVGEPTDLMYKMTKLCCDELPKKKMRYLMGVGMPENILECIARGVDIFDCVIPTRNGRNGMLFTWEGIINIRNAKWKTDYSPIDATQGAFVSRLYSKAYLRHLMNTRQMLGAQIATIHNLSFYQSLLYRAQQHIEKGDFQEWKNKTVKKITKRL
jgi:queuine tRNA-ribosyltransferase